MDVTTPGRRRGRRWAELTPGLSPELTELIGLLRDLVSTRGGGLSAVSRSLTERDYADAWVPPSYDTLSRRLRGHGLQFTDRVISEIVNVCAAPDEFDALHERVQELRAAARARLMSSGSQTSMPPPPPAAPEGGRRTAGIAGLQQQINALDQKLDRIMAVLELVLPLAGQVREVPQTRHMLTVGAALPAGAASADATVPRPRIAYLEAALVDPPHRDLDQIRVAGHLLQVGADGPKLGRALRAAFGRALDSARTGRYRSDEMDAGERQSLLRFQEHAFAQAAGLLVDPAGNYRAVDVKVIVRAGFDENWYFDEAEVGKVFLLISADDAQARWSAGTMRLTEEVLVSRRNRDGRRHLNVRGQRTIQWLFRDEPMPPNLLLHLPGETIAQIMSQRPSTARVSALFRASLLQPVDAGSVAAVAMNDQWSRRVRDARDVLSKEGIAVFDSMQARVVSALGLEPPDPQQWLSVPLAAAQDVPTEDRNRPAVRFGDQEWLVAKGGEVVRPLPAGLYR